LDFRLGRVARRLTCVELFMKRTEIEARRGELFQEFLKLPNAWCARALEIANEFGQLAEEPDQLNKRAGTHPSRTGTQE
jgi:hypothetical protein